MASTLVVIPTYNECENVTAIVSRVRAATPDVDVLVVDDSSPDGTGAIADALAASDSSVHVLHRTGKTGLGSAYSAAFRWGLDRGYSRLVEMDADGSHQPEQLPTLLAAADAGADVVLGSRWVTGGAVENWPTYRKLLSRGGSVYSRVALG
ncbi:MAG: glycosyltransferase, partial [Mycetocola sp.]